MFMFFAQKFWEFIDTWIFILRKSFRQVTLLHIYHHSSITFITANVIYDYAGDFYLPTVLNTFVHILMYSHYFISSLGYKTWWNKYLTYLQLTQFLLILAQNLISIWK